MDSPGQWTPVNEDHHRRHIDQHIKTILLLILVNRKSGEMISKLNKIVFLISSIDKTAVSTDSASDN